MGRVVQQHCLELREFSKGATIGNISTQHQVGQERLLMVGTLKEILPFAKGFAEGVKSSGGCDVVLESELRRGIAGRQFVSVRYTHDGKEFWAYTSPYPLVGK